MLCAFTTWGFCLPAKTLLSQGYISHMIESSVERSAKDARFVQPGFVSMRTKVGDMLPEYQQCASVVEQVEITASRSKDILILLFPKLDKLCMCCFCAVAQSCLTRGLWPSRLLCPWDSPGKSTGVGCHALLQGIFPSQGSNPYLPHCRQILYCWAPREAPCLNYCHSFMWFFFFFFKERHWEKKAVWRDPGGFDLVGEGTGRREVGDWMAFSRSSKKSSFSGKAAQD